MAKEKTKAQRKEYYAPAIEVAEKFFQALLDGENWIPLAQKHYCDWDVTARPHIIMFDEFEITRAGNVAGADPDICIGVYVKLQACQLAGSIPKREIGGRIAVWKETGPMEPSVDGTWGVAPNSFRLNKSQE